MKLGIIGVGNIAQKAYLPTYSRIQDQAELYFATRNTKVQNELRERYGFENVYRTLNELIKEGIDACMIHTATNSHYGLIKQCLEQNIHVFVDKPISEDLAEVEVLLALAEQKEVILMAGFNRRFAPKVAELKEISEKRILTLQKNRVAEKLPTEYVIYDLFLHLADAAVYLLDEPIIAKQAIIKEHDGYLEFATLQLETENSAACLSMDLKSGANTEMFQITSPDGTVIVKDLVELERVIAGKKISESSGDWTSTLEKRGFQQMVTAFIEGVRTGNTAILKQEDVLLSHQLCQEMIDNGDK